MRQYHAQDTSVINLLMKIKGKGYHWQTNYFRSFTICISKEPISRKVLLLNASWHSTVSAATCHECVVDTIQVYEESSAFFQKLTFYGKVLGEKSDLDVAQEM
jgi:hypothetical protein